MKVIELLPWSTDQIVEFAKRFSEGRPPIERQRVASLIAEIKRNGYESFYGDIPRRPLFLRMILESVAALGIHSTDRATLVEEWLVSKIARDRDLPVRKGGTGRQPLVSELSSFDVDVELSFLAMEIAAGKMTQVHEGSLELLPDCLLKDVLGQDPRLARVIDPTGLFLHSVLIPLADSPVGALRIRFGHRSYQEYFLARYILRTAQNPRSLSMPAGVMDWMVQLEATTA